MRERYLTFHVRNGREPFDLRGVKVELRGARMNPVSLRIGNTLQDRRKVPCHPSMQEAWLLEGPDKTWGPGESLSFEAFTSQKSIIVYVGTKTWELVCP